MIMADIQLTCNLANCHKKLNNQACVTSCSHIVCSEHLPNMLGEDARNRCLACGTQLRSEVDYMQVNLNPSEQYKTMVLMGLNPEQVMDIANRAISFFLYQLNYNNRNKENIVRQMKEQIEELKHYCSSLTLKFKTDLQKEQRKAASIKHHLEEKIKELEIQQQQIAQCKKENKRLQMQLESQKREMFNMRISSVSEDNNNHVVTHPHLRTKLNSQLRVREPLNSQIFNPTHNHSSNSGFGCPAQFLTPLKHYGRFSH